MKKIVLVLLSGMLAACSADACMTFVVGKKASKTGYVIVGHNEDDWPPLKTHHGMLPARDWPAGSLLPATKGCNPHIPQVAHTFACYWGEVKFPYGDGNADTFLNEKGVLVVSDSGGETTERMDDPTLLNEGGIKFNLRRAVGERATSARDGVRIMGELIEQYGYAPAARIYTIADKDEAWLVQVIHGKNYVAVRCPDDEVTIMPNLYTVYELEGYKPDEVRVSANLVANARAKGFWDGQGRFNFARAYQGSYGTSKYPENVEQTFEHPNNTGRFRQAICLLTGEEWPEKKPFPFSVKPKAGAISVDDLRGILTAHNGPLVQGRHVLQSWSICSATTIESELCVFGATAKETEMRVAFGRGCEQPYHAFRPFAEPLPAGWDESATAEERLRTHVEATTFATVRATSNGLNYVSEWVRGKDGVGIYTSGALPAEGVRLPTVITRSPYIRNADRSECTNMLDGARIARKVGDHVTISQHCRGRGASEGLFAPYVSEREDGLALLDWVRQLPSYDGRIYLFGGSYGATVHFAYLNTAPEDIVGAALIVQDCHRYNICYRNGFFKIGLTGLWYKSNYHNKVPGRVREDKAEQTEFPLIEWSGRYFHQAEPSFDKTLLHPRKDDPFWSSEDPDAGRDYGEAITRTKFPVLMRTGLYDIYTEGVLDMWREMTPERRANCALIVEAYDHGGKMAAGMKGTCGEFPQGDRDALKVEDAWHAWCFGRSPAEFGCVKLGCTTYYALWENAWHTEPELKDGPRTVTMKFSAKPEVVTYVYDPHRAAPDFPGSGGICFGGMQRQREPNFREDVKSYQLPITERLDVRGRMRARLTVRSDCEDTCFYLRVSVKKDDGAWYLLRDDITSLAYDQGPYEPNTLRTLDFRFADHAFRLEPGDILRVDVASASPAFAPHPNKPGNPNLCRTPQIAHNTILPHASEITLPCKAR